MAEPVYRICPGCSESRPLFMFYSRDRVFGGNMTRSYSKKCKQCMIQMAVANKLEKRIAAVMDAADATPSPTNSAQ